MDSETPAMEGEAQAVENLQAYTELKPLANKDAHTLISKVEVASESVVATLRVTTAKAIDQLDVLWGDGGRDTLTHPNGFQFDQQPPNADAPTLPQDTYTLYHRYSEGNGDPFQREISVYARLGFEADNVFPRTDSTTRRLSLTPLYTVHASAVMARLTNFAAPPFVEHVRFRIIQKIDVSDDESVERHIWDWPAPNGAFPDAPPSMLVDSEITKRRMKASDEVNLWYVITKPVSNWFDPPPGMVSAHIGPRTEQGWVDKSASEFPIRFRYYIHTQLLVPVDPDQQPVVDA